MKAEPGLPLGDQKETIDRYRARYSEYGYSPETLGWKKRRQPIRFEVLTSMIDPDEADISILDIGCGFGDLNQLLALKLGDKYRYTGIDLVPELIEKGRELYSRQAIEFIEGDFLSLSFENTNFDYIVASGIFNHQLREGNNLAVIEQTMRKAFSICRKGIAFDFLSNRVDHQLDHTFHSDPATILQYAFDLSRNVSLRNDYMPFEFAVFANKDDSFNERAVFTNYRSETNLQI